MNVKIESMLDIMRAARDKHSSKVEHIGNVLDAMNDAAVDVDIAFECTSCAVVQFIDDVEDAERIAASDGACWRCRDDKKEKTCES